MPCSPTPESHLFLPCWFRWYCLLENWRHRPLVMPVFGAQSHASAYGLQSSCLRLTHVVTSMHSRLSTGWVVPFPDRHFRRLLIKRLVAHQFCRLGPHTSFIRFGQRSLLDFVCQQWTTATSCRWPWLKRLPSNFNNFLRRVFFLNFG